MVVEEVVITLSGGAPWGFRLQGGAEHKKPLQVAKVRKRSKACRAGLREGDELVAINESSCYGLSHAQAMNLIDSAPGTLHIRVKRSPVGFQSVVLLTRAPSPRIDKEYRAALRNISPASSSQRAAVREVQQGALTSPPGSEAYYGETDSDVDVAHEKHRRQKRRSPSSSPGRAAGSESAEEMSELSGYDSAPDAQGQSPGQQEAGLGVARREVVYQPPQREWSCRTETSTENSSVSTDDQSPRDGAAEEDSGFQEPRTMVPLVSPERAKEAMQLASRRQMVPMVGPVDNPVDEELTTTYMDKAKQAKLNRGDTMQDKQVKEARTKCRTIASLLTDAPNPHSKGVLMFKKRRQRSKKYTLTSFGSVEEDTRRDSQEEEEEEEDGVFPGSESEIDEEGFAAAPDDSTWDNDYLDVLEKKGPAGEEGAGEAESPGLSATSGKGAQLFEQQRRRAKEHAKRVAGRQPQVPPPPRPTETPVAQAQPPPPPLLVQMQTLGPAPPPGFILMNGDPVVIARAMAAPPPAAWQEPASPRVPRATQLPDLPSSNVLNRTARPFAPGFISHRAATAPVVFRPNVAKKTRPATALMLTSPSEMNPAVSQASHPLSVRPVPVSAPPEVSLPPPTVPRGPFPTPPTPATPLLHGIPPPGVNPLPAPPAPHVPAAVAPVATASVVPAAASVPSPTQWAGGRTGILQEALRRGTKKPMFNRPEEKKKPPNPDLLSMVQNLDERPRAGPELGFESGPEEDLFYLGAEACNFMKSKMAPPVAPKPRVIHEVPHVPQMKGKGGALFARKQSRKDLYVVADTPRQPGPTFLPREISPTPSLPSYWKYSSNIRAPPPIGYNPLLSPSCPPGAQRGTRASETAKGRKRDGLHKEGIKAIDAMRRQPYQLNSAMFCSAPPAAGQQYPTQHQGGPMVGSSLSSPRQIPVKAARVYEIKRFSTPTPMSAPTALTPTLIAPRSATSLGEPMYHSNDWASPPPAPTSPPHRPISTGTLPPMPTIPFSNSVHGPAPVPVSVGAYGGLEVAKQFKSAPELSPQRSSGVQVPKPRFVASRMGIQANVWRPGFMHH